MSRYLRENLTYDAAKMIVESDHQNKTLYMKGICIQGGVLNENQRVYPVHEIARAVENINERVKKGSVLGEVDHPDDLKVNLDRCSHTIEQMWLDGPNGFGKLKIIPTPMGNLVKSMLDAEVKLGVSSRGSGEVGPDGKVSGFDIVTIDIVAQPSAPQAYPVAIYEGLMNMKHGHRLYEMARDAGTDPAVQKYMKDAVIRLIKELKL